jgi:hypothetical protein
MSKYIVVRVRGVYVRLYEDITRIAQARIKKRAPPIPNYCSLLHRHQHSEEDSITPCEGSVVYTDKTESSC